MKLPALHQRMAELRPAGGRVACAGEKTLHYLLLRLATRAALHDPEVVIYADTGSKILPS